MTQRPGTGSDNLVSEKTSDQPSLRNESSSQKWLRRFRSLLWRIPLYATLYFMFSLGVAALQAKLLFFPPTQSFDDCEIAQENGFELHRRVYAPTASTRADAHILIRPDASAPAAQTQAQNQNHTETLRYLRGPRPEAPVRVLLFHGNAGAACDRILYQQEFRDLNVEWILAEYPGFGEAGVSVPSQDKLLANALALYDHLHETDATKGDTKGHAVRPRPLVLFGESIGTGIATYIAAQRDVKGLILQAPYPSITDLAALHFWYLPVRWLIRYPFPAEEWAQKVRAPVLILHGVEDDIIPVEFGRRQAQNFISRVEWVEMPGAGHNDWIVLAKTQAEEALKRFLAN